MIRLTPELQAISMLAGISTVADLDTFTRQIDFNLSRRSGVVINSVESTLLGTATAIAGVSFLAQELDLDPDNDEIQWNTPTGTQLESDSSRVIRHVAQTVALTAENCINTFYSKASWLAAPLNERPLSITPVRHHLAIASGIEGNSVDGTLLIRYVIVELTLNELGIINASRR
jgi:hypothetical protein